MMYLDYINRFERTCERQKVASNAQVLYYKLLHIANVTGWPDWIQVDNLRLMMFSDISSQGTLRRARDELVSLGVIEFRSGKRNQPCKYRLVSNFDIKTDTKSDIKSDIKTDTKSDIKSDIKTDTLIRQKNKTKTKKKTTNVVKENLDPGLAAAMAEFKKARVKLGKPMTDYAESLIINKLNKFTDDVNEQIAIVNQSIEHGWQGVFPLKDVKEVGNVGTRTNAQILERARAERGDVGEFEGF